ncbi:MAG: nitrogenase component 1 [Lachnospiraceae bacterium]
MTPGYHEMKDMPFSYNADDGLLYSSPCRGVWNIVHYGLLVPEGHQIYVCPTSCLRGVVLTTAEMGAMDHLSTITVGEDNILNGDMEEELLHGTEKILNTLKKRPRMVMIFTSCIHHFLAVNYQRVYRLLRKEYPDIDFIDCYMDPIMRRKIPADPSLRRQILRVLKKAPKDPKRCSFVGNCFPMNEYCDLYHHLVSNGIAISDLTTMKNYDEFRLMETSFVNFTFQRKADWAGKDLEIRLQQKWVSLHNGYDYDRIDSDMDRASEAMNIPAPREEEIRKQRELTDRAVDHCRKTLAGTPVSLDYTAVENPLELALFLIEKGFHVESVLIDSIVESKEVFEALQKRAPHLKVYSSLDPSMRQVLRSHEGKLVAIGQKSAYFNETDYFVNMTENAGMYGYRGIRRLMELVEEAAAKKKPMRDLVQHKGWHAGPSFEDLCEMERRREAGNV